MNIAVITGASRGLGKSMCLKLAEQGTDIILTYKSGKTEADAVVTLIEAMGRKACALQLDVADSGTFVSFAAKVAQKLQMIWGRTDFDFLVNNAGIGINAPIADLQEKDFDYLTNIHLKGPFFLTQKLLPLIRNGGRIINISSGLTRFSMPGFGAYAAMKGGIEILTHYMALELGARGIAVNTIAPGAIETDFGGGLVRDNKQVNAELASHTALGHVGKPDDIGGAVAMLLSDGGRWINAQRIEVSGGYNI